jgi:hypothetical protein
MTERALFSVALDGTMSPAAVALGRQLASVPEMFRAGGGPSDVIVIDGSEPGWPRRMEAAAGRAKGIFLVDPGPCSSADLDAVDAAVRAAGTPVACPLHLLGNRAWEGAASKVYADGQAFLHVGGAAFRRPSAGDANPLFTSLVEQLSFLYPLWSEIPELHISHLSESQYVVTGVRGVTVVGLTGVLSNSCPSAMSVELVGLDERWTLEVPDLETARPARLDHFTVNGTTSSRPVFQSPGRTAWCGLHRAMTEGSPVQLSFDSLTHVLRKAVDLLALAAATPTGDA